jgi:hypothetical protein
VLIEPLDQHLISIQVNPARDTQDFFNSLSFFHPLLLHQRGFWPQAFSFFASPPQIDARFHPARRSNPQH